jgi:hypothetical protein
MFDHFPGKGGGKKFLKGGENGERRRVGEGQPGEGRKKVHGNTFGQCAPSRRHLVTAQALLGANPLPPGPCSHTIFVFVRAVLCTMMGHPAASRLIRKRGTDGRR